MSTVVIWWIWSKFSYIKCELHFSNPFRWKFECWFKDLKPEVSASYVVEQVLSDKFAFDTEAFTAFIEF